jgi:hypothetical protein
VLVQFFGMQPVPLNLSPTSRRPLGKLAKPSAYETIRNTLPDTESGPTEIGICQEPELRVARQHF